MRRGLVLVAILSLVGAASGAELTLFWSSTGISDPNLMYSTALTNFQQAYLPPTPITFLLPGTYDMFLWGAFPPDWQNYQIYGLDLKWGPDNTAWHYPDVAYRHKWGNQASQKRWDGSTGIHLDGVMAAVMASGITWDTATPAYHLMQPNGWFLIGAARISGQDDQVATVALDFPAPGLGIAVRDSQGNEVPDPTVIPAYLYFTPEPASALLALVGLLTRRR